MHALREFKGKYTDAHNLFWNASKWTEGWKTTELDIDAIKQILMLTLDGRYTNVHYKTLLTLFLKFFTIKYWGKKEIWYHHRKMWKLKKI